MMVWLWVLVIGFVVLVGGMIGGVVVCCVGCGFCGMFGVVLVEVWLWVLWRVVGVVEVVVWRRKTAQSTA
jgi:hypothetical protein